LRWAANTSPLPVLYGILNHWNIWLIGGLVLFHGIINYIDGMETQSRMD
jgi:phosphatidylglycerophosphate synthase